ncbi:PspC domain-containing protein [Marinicrinis lubricantis]|uniref:PspC domain-containing protein n=1 Tax=Marinicrinis lubricantis TaxID=2086470 RepID=A0ABW1IJ94_9BACL
MSRLYRSTRDKKIFGLCGGLAESFNIDATILRLVVVISVFFSAGAVILLYIVASMVIPKEPTYQSNFAGMGSFQQNYPPGSNYGMNYQQPPYGAGGNGFQQSSHTYSGHRDKDQFDEMMTEIEKKALLKEIEELKKKLNQYESMKGDN